MEKYIVKSDVDNITYEFLVGAFPCRAGKTCRYRVFFEGKMIASLEPDGNHSLNIYHNASGFDDELLSLLADEIEYRHPNLIIHPEDNQE